MPEGDTIFRAAGRLRDTIGGLAVTETSVHRTLPTRLPPAGALVDAVDSIGKHCVVTFSSGHVLDSHLLMNGAWHVRPADRRSRTHDGALRARIATDEWVAELDSTPAVRLWQPGEPGVRPWEQLGPDLCDAEPDLVLAVERLRRLDGGTELGEALLDQRPACGIGNVYKSEVLWAEREHPATRIDAVDDETVGRLYATAHRLLRANLHRSQRVTFRGGLAVYGQQRRRCPRCGGRIRVAPQGHLDRVTYWCEKCQVRRGQAGADTTLRRQRAERRLSRRGGAGSGSRGRARP